MIRRHLQVQPKPKEDILEKFKVYTFGNYELLDTILGKGNFARVELAAHKVLGTKVALKVIELTKVVDPYVTRNLEREAKIMSHFNHPNIVKLYEVAKSLRMYSLAMEYIKGCSLRAYVMKEHKLTEKDSKVILCQIVAAVDHMHKRGILHRDLKPENVMITDQKVVKLIDFGLSNFFDGYRFLRTRCGSPEYAAPELYDLSSPYGAKIDVWSIGVILFVLISGRAPFAVQREKNTNTTPEERQQMLQQLSSKGLTSQHEPVLQTLSQDCRLFLRGTIEPRTRIRHTIQELMKHRWFTRDVTLQLPAQQPEQETLHRLHQRAIRQLSKVTCLPERWLEMEIEGNRYGKYHGMYELMKDSLPKEVITKPSNMCGASARRQAAVINANILTRPMILKRPLKPTN